MQNIDMNKYKELDECDEIQYIGQINQNTYLMIYSLYREWFIDYLIKKLDLYKYENEIDNSNLRIESLEENKMDIYQYLTKDKLKYFYLRNRIYLKNLSREEYNFILYRIKINDIKFDNIAYKFIENTYKKIIIEEMKDKDSSNVYISYGPLIEYFQASINGLVLGIRIKELEEDNLSDKEWFNIKISQDRYLKELIENLEIEISNIIKIPCRVLRYEEHEIEKIYSEDDIDKYK